MEIHGDARPDAPVVVDGQPLTEGLQLRGRFGLDTQVTARFLRMLVLLGLRRIGGMRDGWTTPDEIALLLEHGASSAGVAKFMERRLEAYPLRSGPAPPLTHLVQYLPGRVIAGIGGGREGGLSRGPYRLVRPTGGLSVNVQGAWGFLLGPRKYASAGTDSIEGGLDTAEDLFRSGDLIGARLAATAVLRNAHQGRVALGSRSGHELLLATLWDRIANLDMELGAPQLCLAASENALTIHRRLRHPAGQAHALQLKAHAYGQLEKSPLALSAAQDAARLVDNSQNLRSGFGRAEYIGVLGQRLSKVGRHALAERKLEHAQRVAEASGAEHWASIWAVRRAENAMAAGDLAAAEAHLQVALDLGADPRSTVPHEAARVRITAAFLAATGRLSEGREWAERGYRIGIEKGMANQVRLMVPIMVMLGMAPDAGAQP